MIDTEEAEMASAEAEAVEVIKLEAEIDRLRAERVEYATGDRAELALKIEALRAELAEANARANMHAANIEHWKDLAERAVAELAAMKARITSLEEELASTRFNFTGLRNAATRNHRELFARAERAEVELSEAKARIAELELRTNAGNALIRAEKAEADYKRAEAERDALREALRELLTCIDERRPYTTWQGAVADARAALNPSPAGEKT